MIRRTPWREIVALGLVALAARIGASLIVTDPAYLDAAYYELVARRLSGGDGLTVPVIWSFLETGGRLPADPSLPVPSNGHWMPLTGIVSAAFQSVLGPSRFAAELPHALIGAALVAATAAVGWWLWRSRAVAVVAGILAIFAGPMVIYVPMVDSFALFGAFGVVAIAAAIRLTQPGASDAWLLVSAAAIALATLTRVDGLILGVAPLTAYAVRSGIGPWKRQGAPVPLGSLIGAMLVGLVVLAPWLARQYAEFGSIWPSAGGRMMWITEYNDQFSVSGDPSLGSYLAAGAPAIILQKLEAIGLLLGRTTVLLGGFFIVPFMHGLWRERARPDLAPFVMYWVVLFIAMALLFTFHGPAGAWYHSAWAWLPFALPLAVASMRPMLEAIGRRVRLFGRRRNVAFLTGAAVVGAVVLSLVGAATLLVQWSTDARKVEATAAFLETAADRNEVVMYIDPPSLNLLTGNPVVAPPYDPPDVVERVAELYDVRWVVVERATGASDDALDLWDGADWLAREPAFEATDVRVYEVVGS